MGVSRRACIRGRRFDRWWLAAAGLTLLAAWWSAAHAWARWVNYETSAFDLAFFDQIIWNVSQGNGWDSTFIDYSFLGQHAEPVLLLFVPAYWMGAGPPLLMLTQNLVAAAAAVPLFGAARRAGLAPAAALAAAAGYLMNPYLHRGADFDFHPEVMVGLPVFASAWAAFAGRPRLAAGLALATLALKEDAAFAAMFLGVLLWTRGYRAGGAWTAGLAAAYLVVVVGLVMPWARDGADSDLVARFGHIAGGTTDGGVVRAILLHPWEVPRAFITEGGWWSVLLCAAVTSVCAFRRPVLVVAALPVLVLAALSGHTPQAELEFHYAANGLPLLIVAGIVGAAAMGRWRWVAPVVLVAPAVAGFLAFSPLRPWLGDDPRSAEDRAALAAALDVVPADARVAAQSNVLARLTHRRKAYEFPDSVARAEWFVFDDGGHRSSQSLAGGFAAERARLEPLTERVFAKAGVEVRRRIAADPP
ncbi:MAG: DUF2079 domain-containing protein [Dehalococcoidia bacterium]